MINCWAKAQLPHRAEQVLKEMTTRADIVSYNTVIQAYSRVGNVDQAQAILETLIDDNSLPNPNTRTFTALMAALCKNPNPQSAEHAESLLWRMQDLHDQHGWATLPNVVTYNSVLQCWAGQGAGTRARAILEQLHEQLSDQPQERPNAISYNTVMNAYPNDFATAVDLLKTMVERGVAPYDSTYNTLRKILTNDDRIADKGRVWELLEKKYFSGSRRSIFQVSISRSTASSFMMVVDFQ